jgi:hypothetical protein
MEVFALPFVDVATANFIEYADLDDILNDDVQRLFVGSMVAGEDGVIYGPCKFETGRSHRKDLVDWSLTQVLLGRSGRKSLPVPYYLDSWEVKRVERDQEWFRRLRPELESAWENNKEEAYKIKTVS